MWVNEEQTIAEFKRDEIPFIGHVCGNPSPVKKFLREMDDFAALFGGVFGCGRPSVDWLKAEIDSWTSIPTYEAVVKLPIQINVTDGTPLEWRWNGRKIANTPPPQRTAKLSALSFLWHSRVIHGGDAIMFLDETKRPIRQCVWNPPDLFSRSVDCVEVPLSRWIISTILERRRDEKTF